LPSTIENRTETQKFTSGKGVDVIYPVRYDGDKLSMSGAGQFERMPHLLQLAFAPDELGQATSRR
jgi:hypothetical protein